MCYHICVGGITQIIHALLILYLKKFAGIEILELEERETNVTQTFFSFFLTFQHLNFDIREAPQQLTIR